MHAMVIDRYGGPEVLRGEEVPAPQPCPDEIAIRVRAIGVNPADFKWRAGMFAELAPFRFPHVLGYDVAGTVESLGEDVHGLAVGDRVAVALDPFRQGAYAEVAVAGAATVAIVPDGLDFEVAAALPTAGLTGLQLVEEALDVRVGQRLLITGALGAVGRFALFAARRRGAYVIAAVRAGQVADALAIGADEAITLEEGPGDTEPYDCVADTVGGSAVAALCCHLVPGGLIRTVSTSPIPPEDLPVPAEFYAVHADALRLAELAVSVQRGELVVPIARRMPLGEAARAHGLLETGGLAGKIVLIP